MNTLTHLLHCDGSTDRLHYQRNIALLALTKATIDLIVLALIQGTEPLLVLLGWLNPFLLINPWLNGTMPIAICLSTFGFYIGLVWNSVHRARDTGLPHWLGILAAVPYVNWMATFALAVMREKRRSVWDLI